MNSDISCTAKIKNIRKVLSLSQDKFASILGVSRNVVANWEQGRSEITFSQICEANKSFNDYIQETGLNYSEDVFAKYLLGIIDSLEESDFIKRRIARYKKMPEKTKEISKLLQNYNKLSSIDKGKVNERIEFIISTYSDEKNIPTKTIPLMNYVTAEKFNVLKDHTNEFINTNELRATFALKIADDRLEPFARNNDIVLIRQCSKFEIGKVFLVQLCGCTEVEEAFFATLKLVKGNTIVFIDFNGTEIKAHIRDVSIVGEFIAKL